MKNKNFPVLMCSLINLLNCNKIKTKIKRINLKTKKNNSIAITNLMFIVGMLAKNRNRNIFVTIVLKKIQNVIK